MISRTFFGVIKGDTRSLDHTSYPAFEYSIQKNAARVISRLCVAGFDFHRKAYVGLEFRVFVFKASSQGCQLKP